MRTGRMGWLLAHALFASFATGCEEEVLPETVVTGLRVLGVRAEPAELRPGESAQLSALVIDPSRPEATNTLLWLGCEPDPLGSGRSACSDTNVLADPSALAAGGDGGTASLPPGMSLIGFGSAASYAVRADLFAELAADDARRLTGAVGQVLLLAIAEELSPLASEAELRAALDRVRTRETPSVLTLFRLRVTEEAAVNANPSLGALRAGGREQPQGSTLIVPPGSVTPLTLEAPDEARERYVQRLPTGEASRTEGLISAWYSTEGRFEVSRLSLETSDSDIQQAFHAPTVDSQPGVPERRRGAMWIVVRDTRGGQVWRELPIFYCDETLAPPALTAVEPLSGASGTELRLRGTNLGNVVEVLLGGRVLEGGRYSETENTYVGRIPPLAAGDHALVLRGKHCADVETGTLVRVE